MGLSIKILEFEVKTGPTMTLRHGGDVAAIHYADYGNVEASIEVDGLNNPVTSNFTIPEEAIEKIKAILMPYVAGSNDPVERSIIAEDGVPPPAHNAGK